MLPPNVPGDLYQTEDNAFARVWNYTEFYGVAIVKSDGYPSGESYNMDPTTFHAKWFNEADPLVPIE